MLQATILIGDTVYTHAWEIANVLGYQIGRDGKTQTAKLSQGK
ncbi:hypothetical protein [Aneurinibacillus uraniidurans]|nr:hypothetical protein [Aneurinibacillus sp. B1]WCN39163.1 hypothetical protein PO771_07155 [Aneurinibacillus sp. B1]